MNRRHAARRHRMIDTCSSRDPRMIEFITNIVWIMYAIQGRWDAGHSKTSWLNGLSLVYVLVFNLVMSWQRSKKLQETNETCMHSHSFSHLRPIKPSVVSLARSSALSTDQRVSFHMTSYHISFSTGCFYYLGPEPCQCPHEICSGTFILGSVSGNINWLYYLVLFRVMRLVNASGSRFQPKFGSKFSQNA